MQKLPKFKSRKNDVSFRKSRARWGRDNLGETSQKPLSLLAVPADECSEIFSLKGKDCGEEGQIEEAENEADTSTDRE